MDIFQHFANNFILTANDAAKIMIYHCINAKSTELCPHDLPKCKNCQQSHAAHDQKCEHFRALLIKNWKNSKNKL